MSPTPEEFEAAAIERVEHAVRSDMPLMVALHAERAYLLSLPLHADARDILQRLADFPAATHDFDKTPTSVRIAFDRLRAEAAEMLKDRH